MQVAAWDHSVTALPPKT